MLWYSRDRQGCCITTALNSTLHCKPKVTCTHLCQCHDATTQSIVLYIATLQSKFLLHWQPKNNQQLVQLLGGYIVSLESYEQHSTHPNPHFECLSLLAFVYRQVIFLCQLLKAHLNVLYHPSITCIYNVDNCVKSKVLSSCHCFYATTMDQVHDGDSVNWNWVRLSVNSSSNCVEQTLPVTIPYMDVMNYLILFLKNNNNNNSTTDYCEQVVCKLACRVDKQCARVYSWQQCTSW